MTWHVDHTTPGFEPPFEECDRCDGEGYFYAATFGYSPTNPIVEIPCSTCHATGEKQ